MKTILIPHDAVMRWDKDPDSTVESYPVKKYVLEHEVARDLWSEQRDFAIQFILSSHDSRLDNKKCTRVNDIKWIEYPNEIRGPATGRDLSHPDFLFVVTVSRAIETQF
jgi:hypothetical protein